MNEELIKREYGLVSMPVRCENLEDFEEILSADEVEVAQEEAEETPSIINTSPDDNVEFETLVTASDIVQPEIVDSPLDIHSRICANFGTMEKTFYEIGLDLKAIRDNRYYKDLGFKTFEKYCVDNFGLKRVQVHKYISIVENLTNDFVSPVKQIGMRKLYCLSRLGEDERQDLLEAVDIQKIPAKELETLAKEVKAKYKNSATEDAVQQSEPVSFADFVSPECVRYVGSLSNDLVDLNDYFSKSVNLQVESGETLDLDSVIQNLTNAKKCTSAMSKACGNLIKELQNVKKGSENNEKDT